jgi:hypothetical protein
LQGDFLGTVEYITFEELPVKAKTDILNKFKNFTFTSALKIINRPADNENFNDVGTYWVDLSNSVKQIIVSVSPSQSVALHKSFAIQTTASN